MGAGITLTLGERMIVLIYGSESRQNTIHSIDQVIAVLEPDETELRQLMKSTNHKLRAMSDQEYHALGEFP